MKSSLALNDAPKNKEKEDNTTSLHMFRRRRSKITRKKSNLKPHNSEEDEEERFPSKTFSLLICIVCLIIVLWKRVEHFIIGPRQVFCPLLRSSDSLSCVSLDFFSKIFFVSFLDFFAVPWKINFFEPDFFINFFFVWEEKKERKKSLNLKGNKT